MKRKVIIPYNPKLKEVARQLRKSGTLSEVLLWKYLKKKKMRGYDFDRQKPLSNYIVDFLCNELMLAIEIDGCSHNEKAKEDRIRQAKLESLGIRFLRFHDSDIKKNIQGVLWVIEDWIRKHKDEPTPNPSQEGNKKAAGDSRGVNKYTPVPSQEGKKHTPNPLSRGEYKSPLLGRETGVGANKDGEL
ncbi:MAG: endonuclease domain-containing protein [Candidatus Brocadiaceae bacterium]|nr:endonuclease domain-containing protein [Candidatus Brocadiaceae bacterium]